MQTRYFAVLALLLLSSISYFSLNSPKETNQLIQRQEEVASELIDVYYQAKNEEEETMIDMLWLQEAARLVEENGGNFFNIMEQRMGIDKLGRKELTYIEGIVEITDDFGAEFSAEEINRINVEELL